MIDTASGNGERGNGLDVEQAVENLCAVGLDVVCRAGDHGETAPERVRKRDAPPALQESHALDHRGAVAGLNQIHPVPTSGAERVAGARLVYFPAG